MWCKNFFSGWECWGIYSLVHIIIHGLPMGAETAGGVEQDQMADRQKAEIDSSAPFSSVRAAVSMFGDCIQTGHAHHPQPHSSSHQGYVGHQAPYGPSHNAEKIATLENKLLLAHEELAKSQTALSVAESEKAKVLRELVETRVQVEDKF
jgi:hypothetical protein